MSGEVTAPILLFALLTERILNPKSSLRFLLFKQ